MAEVGARLLLPCIFVAGTAHAISILHRALLQMLKFLIKSPHIYLLHDTLIPWRMCVLHAGVLRVMEADVLLASIVHKLLVLFQEIVRF